MSKTRIALLGTLSELHKQPIRYDLNELRRIVADVQPELLGVEAERDSFERDDLSHAPVEIREALVPLARRSDTVVVPIGAGSNVELRASGEGLPAALIRRLDAAIAGVQRTANDARRVNSALITSTCGLICHLEEYVCGEPVRGACKTANGNMLENVVAMVRRDPAAHILVAVQCRRLHWLKSKLRRMAEIELVEYWEL